MRRRLPSRLELLDRPPRRVGQLVAQQAEDALAHELGGEEALGAVGDLVLARRSAAPRAGSLRISSSSALRAACPSPRSPARAPRSRARRARVDAASRRACAWSRDAVDLVQREDHRLARRQERQHRHRRARPSPAPRPPTRPRPPRRPPGSRCGSSRGSARSCAASGSRACRRRRTARRSSVRMPVDAVARGLGLARGDRHVRADEVVQQRRLADVGPADDRDGPGAERRRSLMACAVAAPPSSCASTRLRRGLLGGAPAGARRPLAARPRSSTRHSTVKVCSCASPSVAMHGVARQREARGPAGAPAARSWDPCPRAASSARSSRLGEQALDRRARRLEARVEEDRAQQRLERVGEDRRARGSRRSSARPRPGAGARPGPALRRPRRARPGSRARRAAARGRLREAGESARRAAWRPRS